ncbi:MAG: glycosyltransferase family 4 protein [Saprospiraceae bacterium]|jgi:colanic acid/amylovoran biosynthesis glycosyltransferase|nr:glycosyltransferase family 4 protein [Saprospiraceae bacterium]
MSKIEVLHLVDTYLPLTMRWLEQMMALTEVRCSHAMYADHYICEPPPVRRTINFSRISAYPLSWRVRFQRWLQRPEPGNGILRGYALIHVHFGHMALRHAEFLLNCGIPFCISLYGFDYEYLVQRNPKTLEGYRRLAEGGGVFIVEGNYSRSLLISYGIPAESISIVHMLFDRGPMVQMLPAGGLLRLVQLATFNEKKNQLGVLEALRTRHAGKFSFTFYGESNDRSYYREIAGWVRSHPEHSVVLRGSLDEGHYLQAIRHAHWSVQWSRRTERGDTEGGCPVFLKDSLALGRPVMASPHCDIPDLLVHGYNGLLAVEGDEEALTAQYDFLLRCPPKQQAEFQKNAWHSVHANAGSRLSATETLGVYKGLVGQGNVIRTL